MASHANSRWPFRWVVPDEVLQEVDQLVTEHEGLSRGDVLAMLCKAALANRVKGGVDADAG